MRALIIAPPSGYLKLLKPLPEVLTPSSKTGAAASPFVQVFVTRLFDISKFAKKAEEYAAPNARKIRSRRYREFEFFPGQRYLSVEKG